MKTILKQLFYMNLALLLVGFLVIPAAAEALEEYTLTLHGAGSATHQETGAAGTAYALADYLFQRDSYVQVAWSTKENGGELHRLNALYVPATSTDLYAFWVEAGAGEVVLNGLGGDLDEDGTFYRKYSGAVTLPEQLTYENDGNKLLAWSTEVQPSVDAQGALSGQWYVGSHTVIPAKKQGISLYGQPVDDGAYVIYHPTEGFVDQGGSILVQRAKADDSDWVVTTVGETYFVTPAGCTLAGWALGESSEQIDYEAQASLILQDRECVELYAVWEKERMEFFPESGVSITAEMVGDQVSVTLSPQWCEDTVAEKAICALYNDADKMLACGSGSLQVDGTIQITLNHEEWEGAVCKIFPVDARWCPVRDVVFYTLSDHSGQ